MDTAILIPSLYRDRNLQRVIESIQKNTSENYTTYFMVPEDDTKSIEILDGFNQAYCTDSGDMRFVKRIQFMYENTNEEFIFTGADDLLFHEGWLRHSIRAIGKNLGAVVLNDMHNPNGTNFLIRRKYIEQMSGVIDSPNTVFHQGYFHNYCDTEFIATAKYRNMLGVSRGIVEHLHPHAGKAEDDRIYALARSNYSQDAALFGERSRLWT